MKRICCEICGSSDILKDGGAFVCQGCGCKYTLEEARKMVTGEDSDNQTKEASAPIDQLEDYNNMLAATRDAMMDGRFESAYYNSVRLIAAKPDVPELVAIQALATLGLEAIDLNVPQATVKGMERFYTMFDAWKADDVDRIRAIRHVQGYVGAVCQAQETMLREEQTNLESYRYTPSMEENLISLKDTVGALVGDLYSTVHGMTMEQDNRQQDADNRILDNQLEKTQEKLGKVEAFRTDQLDRLAKRLQLTQDAIIRAKQEKSADMPEQSGSGDEKNYTTINDREILCNQCGSLQPIRRIGGVCWKCGIRFSK